MAKDPKTVSIDGKTYNWDELSPAVRKTIAQLRDTDETIRRLKHELLLAQTAQRVFTISVQQSLQK